MNRKIVAGRGSSESEFGFGQLYSSSAHLAVSNEGDIKRPLNHDLNDDKCIGDRVMHQFYAVLVISIAASSGVKAFVSTNQTTFDIFGEDFHYDYAESYDQQ